MDREASDVHLTKMRSVMSIRCLPKDAAIVVDFHRFTHSHLEAIFDINKSRIRLRSSTTVDGKDVRLRPLVFPVQRDILLHRHSQLSDLTIRLNTTTSLKSISQKRWLYHQMFKLSSDQFNSQVANHVTSHSLFLLVNCITADVFCYYDHKYINIHRHQLFIFSEINSG